MGAAISLTSPDINFATEVNLSPVSTPSTSYAYLPTNTKSFGISASISQSYTSTSATLRPLLTYTNVVADEAIVTVLTCSDLAQTAAEPTFTGSVLCDIAGTAIPPGVATLGFNYVYPTIAVDPEGLNPEPTIFTNYYGTSFAFSVASLTPTTTTTVLNVTTTSISTSSVTTTVTASCSSFSISNGPSSSTHSSTSSVPTSSRQSFGSSISISPSSRSHASHAGGPSSTITSAPYIAPSGSAYPSSIHHHASYEGDAASSASSYHGSSVSSQDYEKSYGKNCHKKRNVLERRQNLRYGPPDLTFGPGVPAYVVSTSTSTSTSTLTTTSITTFTTTVSASSCFGGPSGRP